MSLDFDWSKVNDYKELHADANELAKSNHLPWLLMGIGIGSITAANTERVFRRAYIWQQVHGPLLSRYMGPGEPDEEYPLTLADIERRIGYRTNASAKTDKVFIETLTQRPLIDQRRELNRAQVPA